jgi:hypothetical protein
MPHSPMTEYIPHCTARMPGRREEDEMKRPFVRALSLVSLLAVPAGLIAQAAAAPTPSTTTTTTTTTEKKMAVKKKATKKHHKMHHHMKSTAPAAVPTPASK